MKIEFKDPLWPKFLQVFCDLAIFGLGVMAIWYRRRFDDPFGNIMGILMMVAGGGSLLWNVLQALFVTRVRLRIDDAGIFDRSMGVGVIPWADLRQAFVQSDHFNYRICLDVAN